MTQPTRPPAVVVFGKAPRPGHVKTRLCPPCSPEQAAALAEAMLADSLEVARQVAVRARLVFAIETPAPTVPRHEGFTVIRQRGHSLNERLANALADAGGPAVLIGTDTPQLPPEILAGAAAAVEEGGPGAVIGRTVDGGFWSVGVTSAFSDLFTGVDLRAPQCWKLVLAHLRGHGMNPAVLPQVYRDIDRIEDALAVAAEAPDLRFSKALRRIFNRSAAP